MLHPLGAGVLGPVFRGVGPDHEQRAVALKVLVFDFTPEQAQACAEALQRLASIEPVHPAIVPVISAGTEGSLVYLAQDHVSGTSLDAFLRERGSLHIADALAILKQLAGAIDGARAAGCLYGRLHPRDVLVSLPQVWVTGHGVAAVLDRHGVRTPLRRPYTPPERHAGASWDVTADVYSLGAIAHELLTGRRVGGTGEGVFVASAPTLEPDVQRILSQALAVDPHERHQTAMQFVDALAVAASSPAAIPSTRTDAPSAARLEVCATTVESGSTEVDNLEIGGAAAPAPEPPEPHTHRVSFVWLTSAAVLVAAMSFAAGYGVGITTVSRRIPMPGILADPATKSGPTTPAPLRAWTDGTVIDGTAASAESPSPQKIDGDPAESAKTNETPPLRRGEPSRQRAPGSSAPARSRDRARGPAIAAGSAGTLAVQTRPAGARVFLNGRAVGVSPLVLTDVAAGSHRVGLELAGYYRWSSPVRVESGVRHSVTASLDPVRRY